MSSCFPLFSKFKIPKISTSLSAIGTFFCYKRGANMQSSTSEELTTNSSNNSPRNNGDEGVINSSQLSGAITQNGGESHSDSSSSSSMISISSKSSDCNTFSRTTSPELLEPSSDFTPPVDLSSPRRVRGVSRSDAREGAKSPLRFIAAPASGLKFPTDTSENNESLKDNFIKNYIDRIINNMKSSDLTKEDKPSKSLSNLQTSDFHSKILRGRDTRGYRGLPNPEDPNKNQTTPVKKGVCRESALTLVPTTKQEIASRIVAEARRNANASGQVQLTF